MLHGRLLAQLLHAMSTHDVHKQWTYLNQHCWLISKTCLMIKWWLFFSWIIMSTDDVQKKSGAAGVVVVTVSEESVGSKHSSSSDGSDDVGCMRGCVNSRCPEAIDCTNCLKECTCDFHHWCRGIKCGQMAKETFTVANAKDKFPILKWLPKYRWSANTFVSSYRL